MKIVKTILTLLVILCIVFIAINVFIPASYRVQRFVEIDASPKKSYNYLRDFNNLEEWNVWAEGALDSSFKFEGQSGEENSNLQFINEGHKMELNLVKMVPTHTLQNKIVSEEFPSYETLYYKIEQSKEPGQTKLTMGIQGRRSFLLRFFNLMMDKRIAKDLNASLSKLNLKLKN